MRKLSSAQGGATQSGLREQRTLSQQKSISLVDGVAASPGAASLSLPAELSLDAWQRIGQQIVRIAESSAWWIGDWLVHGQEHYPDRYRRALKETSLDYQTLRNYAWVARTFPLSRRREKLGFQHHVEVAALPADEQDHWLDLAVRFGWSKNELRRQLKASNEGESHRAEQPKVRLALDIPPDRVASWKKAAEGANCSLVEWILTSLDKAVREA